MKWRHAVAGAIGSAHLLNGLPCQDAWGSTVAREALIVAISDGAGTACRSHDGSKLAVNCALNFFAKFINEAEDIGRTVRQLDHSWGVQMLDEVRDCFQSYADFENINISDLSATLLVAVFHEQRSVFYQIGDGAWCVHFCGVLGAATWPTQGEFAGQTAFVTSSRSAEWLQYSAVEGRIDSAIGMSDGLERLALNFSQQTPHDRFYDPMVSKLKDSPGSTELQTSLELFLASERVCQRTDDDKSIAIVVYENCI